ncbi:hypothetical protein UREOM_0050 [Ureaplasma sp. OM1]|uniref:Uncharacterized protein n=1 Tax=Ureaplasma ceti TaxID=3119530 RepID=A0ABP9UA10_9BACT
MVSHKVIHFLLYKKTKWYFIIYFPISYLKDGGYAYQVRFSWISVLSSKLLRKNIPKLGINPT